MKTVLLVDDLAMFRELIANVLRRAGHRVICAGDGREALARMTEAKPDVIFLDLAMPVMDGLTFLETLRSDPANAGIRVILLTDSNDRQGLDRALAKADGYLMKSRFSLKELTELVEKP